MSAPVQAVTMPKWGIEMSEGTVRQMSASFCNSPPPLPLNASTVAPFCFASVAALFTLGELPLVLSARTTSPCFTNASTCRQKISSKP